MANDFSGDPNCEGCWPLDNFIGGVPFNYNFADSSGNNNTLVNGNEEVALETVDYKEGVACADFERSDFWSNHLMRPDADLNADFPLKNGDMNKKISVTSWFKLESVPPANNNYRVINKGDAAGKYSFFVAIVSNGSGIPYFWMGIGYNSGNNAEWKTFTGDSLAAAIWYHYGVTFDDADKSYRIRIWDDDAAALLGGAEQTGTFTNNISVTDGDLWIGRNYYDANRYDGLMDEIVFFNDILTVDEIDQIRQGTYGAAVGNPWWYYEMMRKAG